MPSLNPAEEIVHRLCRDTFLDLWSYENPLQEPGSKELCDALVVCGNSALVFSVKEIGLQDHDDPALAASRWNRRAVEGSVKQLYGAAKNLAMMTHVIQHDGKPAVELPPADTRRVHLIAVAFGGKRRVPMSQGDFGKGFVHVVDEEALWALLRYLDTITDFVQYLSSKETLLGTTRVMLEDGEEDMMAWYLHNNRSWGTDTNNPSFIHFGEGLWEEIRAKPEFKAKLEADKPSYVWDNLINLLAKPWPAGTAGEAFYSTPETTERVLRVMAQETRLSRRLLGRRFLEWHRSTAAKPDHLHSRLMSSDVAGATYVLLATPKSRDRQSRVDELEGRCCIARGKVLQNELVVGLATETYTGPGFSFDACLLHLPEWTEEMAGWAKEAQEKTGAFLQTEFSHSREAEYPGTKPAGADAGAPDESP